MIFSPIRWLFDWVASGGIGVFYVGGVIQSGVQSVTGAVTGKRYAEVLLLSLSPTEFDSNKPRIGVSSATTFTSLGAGFKQNGDVEVNGSPIGSVAPFIAGDVVNIAFDTATGKVWLGKNGAWYAGGDPGAGTGETATLAIETWYVGCHVHGFGVTSGISILKATLRTQVAQLTYAIPSGFTAWYPA